MGWFGLVEQNVEGDSTSLTNTQLHFNNRITVFFIRRFPPSCLYYSGSVYSARLSIGSFPRMTFPMQSVRTRKAWCAFHFLLLRIEP